MSQVNHLQNSHGEQPSNRRLRLAYLTSSDMRAQCHVPIADVAFRKLRRKHGLNRFHSLARAIPQFGFVLAKTNGARSEPLCADQIGFVLAKTNSSPTYASPLWADRIGFVLAKRTTPRLRPAPFVLIKLGSFWQKAVAALSRIRASLLCSHFTSRRSDPRIKTYATPAAAWCGHIFHSGPRPRGDAT